MGQKLTLTTSDNFTLGAYRADPAGKPKGGLVVIQEIFGVNHHIRNVCDRLAKAGYVAIAPQVFDRFARDFEVGYTPDEVAQARALIGNINYNLITKDIEAAFANIKGAVPLGIVGFCMGGAASYVAACRIQGLKAAVSFYGGGIAKFSETEKPKCAVQMHFGEKDASIPLTDVEKVKKSMPEADVYVYEGAAHGFCCDERASFHKDSSELAWKLTHEFLSKHFT